MFRFNHLACLPVLAAGCSAPDYARDCAREFGKISMEDYLAEQGLEGCPGTPDAYCRGRILTRAAASCVGQADAEQIDADYTLNRVDGLAFIRENTTDEVGIAWIFWINAGATTQIQGAMWADSGEDLLWPGTEELEPDDIF